MSVFDRIAARWNLDVHFGFTGRMFDDQTGLQNNLHRWYDAKTGRWLSKDPIGFAAGDANLYRYVGNHSTGAIDPDGLIRSWRFEYNTVLAYGDNGKRGYWIHKYDRGVWYDLFATPTLVKSTFVEFDPTDPPALIQKQLSNIDFLNQCSDAGQAVQDTVHASIFIGGMLLPGPDDAIWAAIGSKHGIKLLHRGSKWVLTKNGNVLKGVDVEVAVKIVKATQKANAPKGTRPAPKGTIKPPIRSPGRAQEFPAGRLHENQVLDRALDYLGPGYREVSPGRYVSADKLRQFRYGAHEVRNPAKHHCHFEALDEFGHVIENSVVEIFK